MSGLYGLVADLAVRDEIRTDEDATRLAEALHARGYRRVASPDLDAHLDRLRADIRAADAAARAKLIRDTRLAMIDEILAMGAPFERIQPGVNWGVSAVRLRALRAEIEVGRR